MIYIQVYMVSSLLLILLHQFSSKTIPSAHTEQKQVQKTEDRSEIEWWIINYLSYYCLMKSIQLFVWFQFWQSHIHIHHVDKSLFGNSIIPIQFNSNNQSHLIHRYSSFSCDAIYWYVLLYIFNQCLRWTEFDCSPDQNLMNCFIIGIHDLPTASSKCFGIISQLLVWTLIEFIRPNLDCRFAVICHIPRESDPFKPFISNYDNHFSSL